MNETMRHFSGPRPLDRLKTSLLHKLHQSNDEKMMISRCLIEEEHYVMSLSALRLLFTAFFDTLKEQTFSVLTGLAVDKHSCGQRTPFYTFLKDVTKGL